MSDGAMKIRASSLDERHVSVTAAMMVGAKSGYVTLEVDLATLMWRLGRQALRNKTGRATLGGGRIKAKVVKGDVVADKDVGAADARGHSDKHDK